MTQEQSSATTMWKVYAKTATKTPFKSMAGAGGQPGAEGARTPHWRAWVRGLALAQIPVSCRADCGKQVMAQITGFPPPTTKTGIAFLSPGFTLAQPWPFVGISEVSQYMGDLSFSLPAYQIKEQKKKTTPEDFHIILNEVLQILAFLD